MEDTDDILDQDALERNLQELLSVTDAAVKSLGKTTKSPRTVANIWTEKDPTSVTSSSQNVDSGVEKSTQERDMRGTDTRGNEADVRGDDSDQSTTASDLLIRSTHVEEKRYADVSIASSSSKSSASQRSKLNFNTEAAQRVKVAKKHLREIVSPTNRSPPGAPKSVARQEQRLPQASSQREPTHPPPQKVQKTVDVNTCTADNQKKPSEKFIPEGMRKDSGSFAASKTWSQKLSKADQVEEHRTFPRGLSALSQGKHVFVSDKNQNARDIDDLDSPMEVEDSQEIITVPERIVNVSATNYISTDESAPPSEADFAASLAASRLPTTSRFIGSSLTQGALMRGASDPDKYGQRSDVQVAKYELTEKERLLKQALTKRSEHTGPVRRVVKPKLVSQEVAKPSQSAPAPSSAAPNMDSLTAAVAASAAVAVTQPFLKAQHDLEQKMSELMEKIGVLEAGVVRRQGTAMVTDVERDQVAALHRQLVETTDQRIRFLEKLQQQQLEMQAVRPSERAEVRGREAYAAQSMHSPPTRDRPSPPRAAPHRKAFSHQVLAQPPQPTKRLCQVSRSRSRSHSRERSRSRSRSGSRRHRPIPMTPLDDLSADSPLSTPAPRPRPPEPFVQRPQQEQQKKRGILEEILASHETPDREATFSVPKPGHRPSHHARDGEGREYSPVRQARRLVEELSSIKDDMNALMEGKNGVPAKKPSLFGEQLPHERNFPPEYTRGPFPLDDYLKFPEASEVSPVVLRTGGGEAGQERWAEARTVLQEVVSNRTTLEDNLQRMLRARQEASVYSLVEALYQDRPHLEQFRIRQMVDDYVSTISKESQREVQAELDMEAKKKAVKAPAPRPGYRGPTAASLLPATSRVTGRPVVPGRQAKDAKRQILDTAVFGASQPRDKENQLKKATSSRLASRGELDTEKALTQVYGKAAYQRGRSTVREPYLHLQPASHLRHPRQVPPATAAGREVKSSKTQTTHSVPNVAGAAAGGATVGAVRQYYFSPSIGYVPLPASSKAGPVPGHLLPMAVPLREPRMEPGVTTATTITPASPRAYVSSGHAHTRVSAATNVAVVSVAADEEDTGRREPELGKQVLPSMDIDTASMVSSAGEVDIASPRHAVSPRSPARSALHVAYHDEEMSGGESHESEEEEEISGTGIALPGYRPPTSETFGPKYPPAVPSMKRAPPEPLPQSMPSRVLAEDMQRRDLLENKAREWIEQELMAQYICKFQPRQAAAELQEDMDVSQAASEASRDADSVLIADTIGQQGLQLFVDAGQPVDNALVTALIREVLQEKVAALLGTRPDREGPPTAQQAQPQQQPAPHVQEAQAETGLYRGRVPTPVPTPPTSQPGSPRHVTPPYTPPESVADETEEASIRSPTSARGRKAAVQEEEVAPVRAEPAATPALPQGAPPPPAPPSPEEESEVSASYDISEELQRLAMRPDMHEPSMASTQIHDVATPTCTPPPEEEEPEPPRPVVVVPSPPPSPKAVQPPPPAPAPAPPQPPAEPAVQPAPPKTPSPPPDVVDAVREEPSAPRSILKHSVATETEPPVFERERSPSPPRRPPSPAPSQSSDSAEPSVSETCGDSVSEGEWLVSRSLGQAAPFPIDDVKRMQPQKGKNVDASTASTLQDTDDIDLDETDVSRSEGEYLFRAGGVPPERDPVLALVLQMQQSPFLYMGQVQGGAGTSLGQFDLPDRQVSQILSTQKSLGEVSVGQVSEGQAPPYTRSPVRERPAMEEPFPATGPARSSQELRVSFDTPESPEEGQQEEQQEDQEQERGRAEETRSILKVRQVATVEGRAMTSQFLQYAPRSRSPQATKRRPLKTPPLPSSSPAPRARPPAPLSQDSLEGSDVLLDTGATQGSEFGTRTLTREETSPEPLGQSVEPDPSGSQGGEEGREERGGQAALASSGPRDSGSLGASGDGNTLSTGRLQSTGRSLGLSYSLESGDMSVGGLLSDEELRSLPGGSGPPRRFSVTIPTIDEHNSDEETDESEFEP